ncbi:MAG: TonB-dependent receptor [Saprospiraceae bacterium]
MKYTILGFLIFFSIHLSGQSSAYYTYSGTVIDTSTGDFIPFVSISDSLHGWNSESDIYGRFTIKLRAGSYKLNVAAVGYESKLVELTISVDTRKDIFLTHISLSEVIIQGRPSIKIENNFIDISPEKLRSVPSLLGEKDVLKALTILPGVSPGYEGTNHFSVRGGGNDQNLILLDGSVLYNTSHLFGFLSAIEPYSIKALRFYKEGFPVEYGGRLSSVVDISLKEGNFLKKETFLNVGMLTSSFGMNGPIIKNRLSYLISSRIAYPGLITLPFKSKYYNGKGKSFTSYFMYDVICKLSLNLNTKNNIYLSFYSGRDFLLSGLNENNYKTDWNINWGNSIAALRYKSNITKNLNLSLNINYNKYNYSSNLLGTALLDDIKTNIENQSTIEDIKSGIKFDWSILKGLDFVTGSSVIWSSIMPKFQFTEINQTPDPASKSDSYRVRDISNFANLKIFPFDALKIDLGVRQSEYSYKDYHFNLLQPRALVSYSLSKKIDVHLANSVMYQPIHLVINQANGFLNDVWIAANQKLQPQKMEETSIGIHYKSNVGDFRLTYFDRNYSNLTELKDNIKLLKFSIDSWDNLLEVNGKGHARGLEVGCIKSFNKFNLIASYTFTDSKRKFININDGRAFPSPLDRKHILNLNLDYLKNERTAFFINLTYFTGTPITLPSYSAYTGVGAGFDFVYTERFNARLPTYKRFDIGLKKTHTYSKGKIKEWTFSIYNLFFNRNVTQILPVHSNLPDINNPSIPIGFRNEFIAKSFLMFIPGINFYYRIN